MSRIDNPRGPLGLKPERKARPKERKGLAPISRKRKAYLASDERKAAKAHMDLVAGCSCIICGARPVEVHHVICGRFGQRRASDFDTIPLCPPCHRLGPMSIHEDKAGWVERNGPDYGFLAIVAEMIAQTA